jgi:hypothetical protein
MATAAHAQQASPTRTDGPPRGHEARGFARRGVLRLAAAAATGERPRRAPASRGALTGEASEVGVLPGKPVLMSARLPPPENEYCGESPIQPEVGLRAGAAPSGGAQRCISSRGGRERGRRTHSRRGVRPQPCRERRWARSRRMGRETSCGPGWPPCNLAGSSLTSTSWPRACRTPA